MSENVERCPKCRADGGEGLFGTTYYGCGTKWTTMGDGERHWSRSTVCCEREIATLRAQLAEVAAQRDAALAALREARVHVVEGYESADRGPNVYEREVLREIDAALAQQPATEQAEAERAVVEAAMAAWRGLPKAEAPRFSALMRGLDDACIALAALNAEEAQS